MEEQSKEEVEKQIEQQNPETMFEQIVKLHGCPSYCLIKISHSEEDQSLYASLMAAASNLDGLKLVMGAKANDEIEKNPLVG